MQDEKKVEETASANVEASLKRKLPEGNHAVSYCCEAASQIKPEELPDELPFD